jgi:hypothetical protein
VIISHTLTSTIPSGDRNYVTYEFVHDAGRVDRINKLVPSGFDTEADMVSMIPVLEQSAADAEVRDAVSRAEQYQTPDLVPSLYQPQPDYDRRVLGRCMMFVDVQAFYAALPMWQAMELRGGANANQRAAYLGITRIDYDLMAARWGDVQGIGFFLDDDKNNIWAELPDDFI